MGGCFGDQLARSLYHAGAPIGLRRFRYAFAQHTPLCGHIEASIHDDIHIKQEGMAIAHAIFGHTIPFSRRYAAVERSGCQGKSKLANA